MLAHSPPQVRELILAYTNNALSRQYRPPSAETRSFITDFCCLPWTAASTVFLRRVSSRLEDQDDEANDTCFACGLRRRELKPILLNAFRLQLHRSEVFTLLHTSTFDRYEFYTGQHFSEEAFRLVRYDEEPPDVQQICRHCSVLV